MSALSDIYPYKKMLSRICHVTGGKFQPVYFPFPLFFFSFFATTTADDSHTFFSTQTKHWLLVTNGREL